MIDIIVNSSVEGAGDVFIACIGFEERSTHYFVNNVDPEFTKSLFFDYKSCGVFSYDKNMDRVKNFTGVELFEAMPPLFEGVLTALTRSEKSNVVVDVSSFDREKLGSVLHFLFLHSRLISSVKLVYSPRKFKPIDLKFDVVQSFGPVLPVFLGDAAYGRNELCLILGAGYEYGKAVGAVDMLEPDEVYCFRPTGTHPGFDEFIDKANVNFNFIENKNNIVFYNLNEVGVLYFRLRRLIEVESGRRNVMILPMGPKMFAAVSMVIGLVLHPSVMIWRHSSCTISRPESIVDAKPSGKLLEFSFSFCGK